MKSSSFLLRLSRVSQHWCLCFFTGKGFTINLQVPWRSRAPLLSHNFLASSCPNVAHDSPTSAQSCWEGQHRTCAKNPHIHLSPSVNLFGTCKTKKPSQSVLASAEEFQLCGSPGSQPVSGPWQGVGQVDNLCGPLFLWGDYGERCQHKRTGDK